MAGTTKLSEQPCGDRKLRSFNTMCMLSPPARSLQERSTLCFVCAVVSRTLGCSGANARRMCVYFFRLYIQRTVQYLGIIHPMDQLRHGIAQTLGNHAKFEGHACYTGKHCRTPPSSGLEVPLRHRDPAAATVMIFDVARSGLAVLAWRSLWGKSRFFQRVQSVARSIFKFQDETQVSR